MRDQQPTAALTSVDLKANLGDIQGGILDEYETLACAYIFYTIEYPERGRAWLNNLVDQITTSGAARSKDKPERTLNVSFSPFGLAALGVSQASRDSFPYAFREGMAARAHRLGDTGPGDPSRWEGGLGTSDIHVMVTITDADCWAVDDRRRALKEEAARYGVNERHFIDAAVVFDQRSGCPAAHFGYVDPVSQPAIAGLDDDAAPGHGARTEDGWRGIAPGEFLLGYVNE